MYSRDPNTTDVLYLFKEYLKKDLTWGCKDSHIVQNMSEDAAVLAFDSSSCKVSPFCFVKEKDNITTSFQELKNGMYMLCYGSPWFYGHSGCMENYLQHDTIADQLDGSGEWSLFKICQREPAEIKEAQRSVGEAGIYAEQVKMLLSKDSNGSYKFSIMEENGGKAKKISIEPYIVEWFKTLDNIDKLMYSDKREERNMLTFPIKKIFPDGCYRDKIMESRFSFLSKFGINLDYNTFIRSPKAQTDIFSDCRDAMQNLISADCVRLNDTSGKRMWFINSVEKMAPDGILDLSQVESLKETLQIVKDDNVKYLDRGSFKFMQEPHESRELFRRKNEAISIYGLKIDEKKGKDRRFYIESATPIPFNADLDIDNFSYYEYEEETRKRFLSDISTIQGQSELIKQCQRSTHTSAESLKKNDIGNSLGDVLKKALGETEEKYIIHPSIMEYDMILFALLHPKYKGNKTYKNFLQYSLAAWKIKK